MKLNCPICGFKIINDQCYYCNITSDQITGASNIAAKEKIKKGDRQGVYYSSYLPHDVNRKKLLTYTLLGLFGIDDFYLGKRGKGLFHLMPIILLLFLQTVVAFSNVYKWGISTGIGFLIPFVALLVVIGLLIWARDIVKFITKKTKVPVVLAESKKEVKNNYKRSQYHKKKMN